MHGALLDSEILSDVYLAMTGGQVSLNLNNQQSGDNNAQRQGEIIRLNSDRAPLKIVMATDDEQQAHRERLELVQSKGGQCLWLAD